MFDIHYGTCDCDRSECHVARAVRAAAAEKLLAAMQAEYGDTWDFKDFPLSSFPSYEWVCRAFPRRSSRACPGCGYIPAKLSDVFTFGTVFGLKGVLYRVVSVGSTNKYCPNRMHFEDYATCEPAAADHWSLPKAPALKSDVAASLNVLFDLPKFRWMELSEALIST